MDKKLANAKQKKLLWVDLEMTGLDPKIDRIMEVAAIVTDWDFNQLATYEGVVAVGKELIEQRMLAGPSAEFWNSIPDVRDVLINQSTTGGLTSHQVESELLAFVDKHFEKGVPVLLAGNSIHIDRQFITSEWKRFDARLHYRMLDVTAWKVVFEGKFGKKFAKLEVHRALDDIRGSMMELRYYLEKVKAR